MAQRCKIGLLNQADRSVEAIYLHKGSEVIQTLNEYYNKIQDVSKLIGLGGLSVLTDKLDLPEGVKGDIQAQTPVGYTLAYHRDGGEELHIARYNRSEEQRVG